MCIIDAYVMPLRFMVALVVTSACCAWSIFHGALTDSFILRSAVRAVQFVDPMTAYQQAMRCGVLDECASIDGIHSCAWIPQCIVRCGELTFADMMIDIIREIYPSLIDAHCDGSSAFQN
jgi:hypothetical protein